MTVFPFKKYVSIQVDLEVGDKVQLDNWGSHVNGKVFVIEELSVKTTCESGVMVRLNEAPKWVDSGWVIKL